MKITVIGAGAMGSIYAGLLADAGNEVWAVDIWQEHIDAIRALQFLQTFWTLRAENSTE